MYLKFQKPISEDCLNKKHFLCSDIVIPAVCDCFVQTLIGLFENIPIQTYCSNVSIWLNISEIIVYLFETQASFKGSYIFKLFKIKVCCFSLSLYCVSPLAFKGPELQQTLV